jgi:hypothetical protein
VNHHLWAFVPLDLARQRAEEVNDYHLASLGFEGEPSSPSRLRRSLARGLAAISRGSAAVVRKLDGRIADNLGRSLAPTE